MLQERAFTSQVAIEKAKQEINRLGLSYETSHYGDLNLTYECHLKNNNKIITSGYGKGLGNQSEISALYEALEHYYTEYEYIEYDNIYNVNVSQLIEQVDFILDKPFEILSKKYPSSNIPCFKYINILNGSDLYYPIFLSKPNSNPLECIDLAKYASNSGTAIGLNNEECLIHSINELIERDAFSLFLIKTFINREKKHEPKVVDIETIGENLKLLVSQIELQTKSKIIILDFTTEFGVSVFGSALLELNFPIQIIGLGASINSDYALERALLESLQLFHLYDDSVLQENTQTLNDFKKHQRYLNCAVCDIEKIIKERSYQLITYHKNECPPELSTYLDSLKNQLSIKGFHIYFRLLTTQDSLVSCIHTIIPGLEKFNIIRNGCSVLPSKRGMEFA